MGAFGDLKKHEPLTNRGVELAEATFCGAETSERGPHDSGQIAPWARGDFSMAGYKSARPRGVGVEP